MANEDKKDFNAMLHDNKDMPKIQIITDQKSIEKYGGSKMYFAPPIDYDRVMKQIPYGKVITIGKIREFLYQFLHGRVISVLKMKRLIGELNSKYPGGIEAQKLKLEAEGHIIISKGRTNIRYFVKDYEKALFEIK